MEEKREEKKELGTWECFRLLFFSSRGFQLVNIVNFGDGIAYFGILTLLTRFLGTRVGMPDQAVGMSVSAYTGLVTLFMFGGGFVSDRLGVRRALSLSLFVILIGRIFLTLSPELGVDWINWGSAWFGLLLMAGGTGVLQPALYAGIKEYTDPRTATIGYGLLYSIMNLGIVAENFLSPYVRTEEVFLNLGFREIVGLGWGIDGVFWVCTAITAAMLLIHMALFSKRVEDTQRTVVDPNEGKPRVARPILERMKDLPFLDARFMYFIFILLPVRTLFAHQFLTMPDYVFRCFPESVSAKFEWINGLNPLVIVIFVPLIAAFTRKIKVIDMMIVGTALSAVTTFLLVPGPHLSMLLTYVILFSLGEAVWSSRFLEHIADIAPAGRVGAYMGLGGIPWFMAKFTTGLYSGSMLERFIPSDGHHDSSTLWLVYAFVACASPIGLVLARRWLVSPRKADQK